MTDRVTGYSKGFGFVKYATLEDAAKGIEGMDGKVSWDHFPVFSFKMLKFIWCVLLSTFIQDPWILNPRFAHVLAERLRLLTTLLIDILRNEKENELEYAFIVLIGVPQNKYKIPEYGV